MSNTKSAGGKISEKDAPTKESMAVSEAASESTTAKSKKKGAAPKASADKSVKTTATEKRSRKKAEEPSTEKASAKKVSKAKASAEEGGVKPAKKAAAPARKKRTGPPSKILYAVSEVSPFISTGGMGQVVGTLPTVLHEVQPSLDVRVVAPYYRQVRMRFGGGMTYIGNIRVPLAWRSQYCGVFRAERDGVTYYFLDNEQYFDRDGCYGHFDDGERFAFFSKAVMEVLELIDFEPDIIHAHDWHTALVPIYLKTLYGDKYPDMRSVFTIHNIEYQGQFPLSILSDVFDLDYRDRGIVEYNDGINLMKGAIVCCDRFTTVSPSYAEEIKESGGHGLEPIIRMNKAKLSGIINGIDTKHYNPETDPTLPYRFSVDTIENKALNKRDLQMLFGLPVSPRKPLLCIVSRLVSHKGLDLISAVMEDLLRDGVQFVVLGTGDHEYELYFNELAMRHPQQVSVSISYNPEIGNKIYGGSDITLVPSRSEPCGLAQMIACRYATIPIVRATGGLRDTIRDCRQGDGNGFVFQNYDAGELLSTIRQAIDLYTYRENDWQNLMREAMRSNFGWDDSAKEYVSLYTGIR